MVIHFFMQNLILQKKRPPKVIFQLDVVHNLPTKLPNIIG
jgi:hypothetical protein